MYEWAQQAYSLLSVVIVVLSPQLRKCSLHTALATEICKKSKGEKRETIRSHKQNKHQQTKTLLRCHPGTSE